MPGSGFTHLHVRSGFSYGYGTAIPEELVAGAAESGYGTLTLTDQDGLYGTSHVSSRPQRKPASLP